jgi:hypothetical protein
MTPAAIERAVGEPTAMNNEARKSRPPLRAAGGGQESRIFGAALRHRPAGWLERFRQDRAHSGADGQIAWINILLSGDNAVVIAMACRGSPRFSLKDA